jgi:hypothetical protein
MSAIVAAVQVPAAAGSSEMVERDAPAPQLRRIAGRSSISDFVADDAADGCAANGPDRAATRQNGTADGTNASTDRGALVLRRHAGTRPESCQHDCDQCTISESLCCFHGITSVLFTELMHRD